MLSTILGGPIVGAVSAVIDKIFPDKAKADEAKLKLLEMQQSGELKALEYQTTTITSESKGESWLQRNWRPLTMLNFTAIIFNNYLLYPYLKLFFVDAPFIVVPPDLWKLLELGISGYILGRTAEKCIANWKGERQS